MGRILGKLEYGNGNPDRYFIHCDTAGQSFAPLFSRPEQAWEAYDRAETVQNFLAAAPMQSRLIFVIKKLLAGGRAFDEDDSPHSEPVFGLASEDRLLHPRDRDGYDQDQWALLLTSDNVLHVSVEVDGGFSGTYDKPVCKGAWTPTEGEQRITFEQAFGHNKLDLCPHCLSKLLD